MLLALLAFAHADEIVIDDEDGSPTFTTTGDDWTTWSHLSTGFDGGDTEYHYLSHTVGGSDRRGTATWTPDITTEGTWEVFIWFRYTENRTNDADHYVYDGYGASHHHSIDQGAYEDGASGWISLGDYYCTAGSGGCYLTLDGTDDDESDEANAAKFVLLSAGGGDGGDGGSSSETDPCSENPGYGYHTQVLYAGSAEGSGQSDDWSSVSNAKGEADGNEASTPNADAGEYLRVGAWGACDPEGDEVITDVTLEVYGRTQYESGSYDIEMALHGGGAAETIWAGTSSAWHEVDLTGDDGAWTWDDINAVVGQVELHDHPGGNRDSDVWVDAFRLTVGFEAAEEGDHVDTGSGAGGFDTATGDVVGDTDAAVEEEPPDDDEPDSYLRETDDSEAAAGCGCASGSVGVVWWMAVLAAARRRSGS